jgi:hypothetical protein
MTEAMAQLDKVPVLTASHVISRRLTFCRNLTHDFTLYLIHALRRHRERQQGEQILKSLARTAYKLWHVWELLQHTPPPPPQ